MVKDRLIDLLYLDVHMWYKMTIPMVMAYRPFTTLKVAGESATHPDEDAIVDLS